MSKALRPLFVNVTWGAGGSTSSRSLELAEICQSQLSLTTCLHLTCTNMTQKAIDEALEVAKKIGIRNILALRGDPPRDHEYSSGEPEPEGSEKFYWAADLVRYIRRLHGDYFCIGVAGYPEGHSDESYPTDQNPIHDMRYLLDKVQAGADFIMTQLFYDAQYFLDYENLVRRWANGAMKDIVIIPGLMPIQNFQILKRTTKLSHSKLPPEILKRLEPVKGDDEEVKRVGVDIVSEIVETIRDTKSVGRRGFHFYTLNLEKVVSFILERCRLIPPCTPNYGEHDSFAVDDSVEASHSHDTHLSNGTSRIFVRRPSSPHNHVVPISGSMSSNSSIILEEPSRATTLAISHGVGSLGREATWDDFTNGRFGDARSPAFGEIDGYGPTLHLSPAAAREKWGLPTTRAEISKLFERHVMGDLDTLPWSEGGLNEETQVIKSELCRMIREKDWWSIASQPAVDGVPSDHQIFGWGPKGGFVFQKAFLEIFVPAKDWKNKLRPRLTSAEIAPEVSWYAAPCPSSVSEDIDGFESSHGSAAVSSVTWGSFPGKEIITPTIIEEVSFRAWVEEAFNIWTEWERCYPPAGVTRRVLREEKERRWLVNIICHSYREEQRLWEILMEA
jgi:methylenetetrahydrofolate reductase (NADPH)